MTVLVFLLACIVAWLSWRVWLLQCRVKHWEFILSRIETTLDGFNERTK